MYFMAKNKNRKKCILWQKTKIIGNAFCGKKKIIKDSFYGIKKSPSITGALIRIFLFS